MHVAGAQASIYAIKGQLSGLDFVTLTKRCNILKSGAIYSVTLRRLGGVVVGGSLVEVG